MSNAFIPTLETVFIVSTPGTGFTINVAATNLDPDLTVKDFIVYDVANNNTSISTTLWTKESRTVLRYNGVSLLPNTVLRVARSTQLSRVQESLQLGSAISSSILDAEVLRIYKLLAEKLAGFVVENPVNNVIRSTNTPTTPPVALGDEWHQFLAAPGSGGTPATIRVWVATQVNGGIDELGWFEVTGTDGINGNNGLAATINVGSTSTGLPGTEAQVVNVGSQSAAVFNFTIPKGDPGTGATGPAGTVDSASSVTLQHIPTPLTPITGSSRLYIKSDNRLYTLGSDGVERLLNRIRLTTPVTIFVRGDGNDTITFGKGLTNDAGNAFLTWQAAIDYYSSAYDDCTLPVVITAGVSGQTFTVASPLVVKKCVGGGALTLNFNGGTLQSGVDLPSVTTQKFAAIALIEIYDLGSVYIENCRTIHTNKNVPNNSCIHIHTRLSNVHITNHNYGALTTDTSALAVHLFADDDSNVTITGDIVVSGGGSNVGEFSLLQNSVHIQSQHSLVNYVPTSYTITGSPTLKWWYLGQLISSVVLAVVSYTGAPGPRCRKFDISVNSVIDSNGAVPEASAFPGDTAGLKSVGAQYR